MRMKRLCGVLEVDVVRQVVHQRVQQVALLLQILVGAGQLGVPLAPGPPDQAHGQDGREDLQQHCRCNDINHMHLHTLRAGATTLRGSIGRRGSRGQ